MTHVLEGSVRKAEPGADHRPAHRRRDRRPLWAERYDRELTDIFAIQDDISQAIVQALQVKLLPEEKKAIETRGNERRRCLQPVPAGAPAVGHWHFDIRRDETIVRICKQVCRLGSKLRAGVGAFSPCPVSTAFLARRKMRSRKRRPNGPCRSTLIWQNRIA